MPASLRILYIAYPLLPVSQESCGGAEQVLSTLEREMFARGHETTVAACDASLATGDLFATGPAPSASDQFEQRDRDHTARILQLLASRTFDIIHDKSGSFWRHAGAIGTSVLATLHLPRAFYAPDLFARIPPNLFFNCVSRSQARTFADLPHMTAVIPNGIALSQFPLTLGNRGYLLWLGRICEEKATHIAIDVAHRAGLPLIIAGQVYPFSYHEQYFVREIRPHLDGSVRFVEMPTLAQKIDLLRHARTVLVPSLVDETSSLVAMEAMACGTPVIAFRRGALPEVIDHSVTGFIVDSPAEMAQAVARSTDISSIACRAHVMARFSAARMADDYETLYRQIVAMKAMAA